jgi:hypothetical protein
MSRKPAQATTGRVARSLGLKRIIPHKKPKSTAKLKKELDSIFSKYIRAKYPKKCYTCGRTGTLQCGHFISRSYLATRFSEDNCRPQCVGCNIFGNGKPLDFEEHLIKEIGAKKVAELKRKRHEITILSNDWYEKKISHYSLLLTQL